MAWLIGPMASAGATSAAGGGMAGAASGVAGSMGLGSTMQGLAGLAASGGGGGGGKPGDMSQPGSGAMQLPQMNTNLNWQALLQEPTIQRLMQNPQAQNWMSLLGG